MKRISASTAVALSLGVFGFFCAASLWACNVPVFRFALERWRPDPYRIVLFHRGDLTAEDRERLKVLEEQEEQGIANLAVRTVDVAKLDSGSEEQAPDAALFASLGQVDLPALVVQYPAHLEIQKLVSVGTPSSESVGALIDSPVRKELINRLASGETAVWLFLESGQPEVDAEAAKLVEEELKKLEGELELPELTDAPEDAIAANAPLKVAFSMLRIRRDDPAEQALISMLIGSEPDLATRQDPMVFPVYGRGRALWALIGAGITARNIRDSASFLVGPCSCEVKELNPGFDLLLSANWDVVLGSDGVPLVATSTSQPEVPSEPELVPIPSGSDSKAAEEAPVEKEQKVEVSHAAATSSDVVHAADSPDAGNAGGNSSPITSLSVWAVLLCGGMVGLVLIGVLVKMFA